MFLEAQRLREQALPFTPEKHETPSEPQSFCSDHDTVHVQGSQGCPNTKGVPQVLSPHTQPKAARVPNSEPFKKVVRAWLPLALTTSINKPRSCLIGEGLHQ